MAKGGVSPRFRAAKGAVFRLWRQTVVSRSETSLVPLPAGDAACRARTGPQGRRLSPSAEQRTERPPAVPGRTWRADAEQKPGYRADLLGLKGTIHAPECPRQVRITRRGAGRHGPDSTPILVWSVSSLVRVVGLEPTLLAKADFESAASTIPPHPQARAPSGSDPPQGDRKGRPDWANPARAGV